MASSADKKLPATQAMEGLPRLSGRLLARNTFYNLLGHALPMPVAVITIPFIIKGLGVERFGILTLAWMAVGYFGLFDLGLGRATTKFAAEYFALKKTEKLPQLIWSSMILLFGLGFLIALVAVIITPWLINDILNVPPDLLDESRKAFYLLAFSVPIVLGTAGARGILEAQQRFDLINIVKIPTYIAAFVSPLLVLPFSTSLFPIVAVLVASRLAGMCAYMYFCRKTMPSLLRPQIYDAKHMKQFLKYGGWLGVSNIITPLMGNMDRFLIGSILTMSAVAYYATPFDMITKLFIVPIGLLGVIFPAFSAYAIESTEKLLRLHQRAVKYILIAMTPPVVGIIIFARPLFEIWLGQEFALQSSLVLQILAAGVLFSSVARVPFNAIQATGRPDLTAKMHLIELPVYLTALFFLVKAFGIMGVALVWMARAIIEMFILFALFRPVVAHSKSSKGVVNKTLYVWLILSVTTAYASSLIPNLLVRSIALIVLISLIVGLAFFVLLDNYEKSKVREGMSRISTIWKGNLSARL